MTGRRPSRSDEHLAVEEEARMEAEVREYFDDMNPKRHTKPSRSECDRDRDPLLLNNNNNNNNPSASAPIPELLKFQDLEAHSQSQKIVCERDESKPVEEYMATNYYDDLNLMDKQHHTTGSGFIKMEESNTNSSSSCNGSGFRIASDANENENENENAWDERVRAANSSCRESKGNPATNDWIPSASSNPNVNVASNKPKRSDE